MPDTTSQSLSEAEIAEAAESVLGRKPFAYEVALAEAILAKQREMDAKAEPVARVQETAPARIYLCVSDDDADADEPFHDQGPCHYGDGVTWSIDKPVSVTVPYVRADLVHPPAAQDREPTGWLPMETAPRDGTRVILEWAGKPINGFYLDNSKTDRPWAGWRTESMVASPPGDPTGWMPFPAARAAHNIKEPQR